MFKTNTTSRDRGDKGVEIREGGHKEMGVRRGGNRYLELNFLFSTFV